MEVFLKPLVGCRTENKLKNLFRKVRKKLNLKVSLNCKIISEAPAGEEKSKTIDIDFLKCEVIAAIDELEHDDNVNQIRAAQY